MDNTALPRVSAQQYRSALAPLLCCMYIDRPALQPNCAARCLSSCKADSLCLCERVRGAQQAEGPTYARRLWPTPCHLVLYMSSPGSQIGGPLNTALVPLHRRSSSHSSNVRGRARRCRAKSEEFALAVACRCWRIRPLQFGFIQGAWPSHLRTPGCAGLGLKAVTDIFAPLGPSGSFQPAGCRRQAVRCMLRALAQR